MAEVPEASAWAAQLDGSLQGVPARLDQPALSGRDVADHERPGGVRAQPVLVDAEIDPDDVPVLEDVRLARDAVDDDLVARRAQDPRIGRLAPRGVVQERAHDLVLGDAPARDVIELPG